MDALSYRGIPMEINSTQEMSVKLVYNESDRQPLWWKWTGDSLVWINPQALSLAQAGNDPILRPGEKAGDAHNALRRYMREPRKALILSAGGANMLRLPQEGYNSDAQNGPHVTAFDILQVHGSKSLLCRFAFEAFEPLGPPKSATNPLISHEWRVASDVDELGYGIRTTTGLAVFRTDVLRKLNKWPDEYRHQLFVTPPDNFRRQSVHVMQDEEGNKLAYLIRDKEKCFNLGHNSPARKVECYLSGTFKRGSIGQAVGQAGVGAAGAVTGALSSMAGAVFGLLGGITGSSVANIGGAAMSLPAGVGGAVGGAAMNNLPRHRASCRCRVWGNRVQNVAMTIVTNRLRNGGVNFGVLGPASTYFKIEHVVHEHVCDVEADIAWGMEGVAGMTVLSGLGGALFDAVGGAAPPAGMGALLGLFEQSEDVVDNGTIYLTQKNIGNPPLGPTAGQTNSYGTWTERLVAQEFWSVASSAAPGADIVAPPPEPEWSA